MDLIRFRENLVWEIVAVRGACLTGRKRRSVRAACEHARKKSIKLGLSSREAAAVVKDARGVTHTALVFGAGPGPRRPS